jgi:hypothetical protein
MSSAVSLEYAPGAPIRRRRRIRRVLVLLVLIGVGLAVWRWGPGAWKHVTLLYWQRQCMNYQVQSDVLLYENDPVKAAALLRPPDSDYVPMTLYMQPHTVVTQAIYYPRSLREFEARTTKTFRPMGSAIIYLHERRTPAGKRRLVVVYTEPWNGAGALWEWAVYDPAGIFEPKLLNSGEDQEGLKRGMMTGLYIPRRLGPGQSDAADPTHFTIPCFVTGHLIGTYDGRLTDEDRVVIAVRDGALKR